MELNKKETKLIRNGSILNILGLFRALVCNDNIISKERWIFLVRKNFFIEENEELSESMKIRIDKAWNESEAFLKDLGALISFSTHEIKMRNLKDLLVI